MCYPREGIRRAPSAADEVLKRRIMENSGTFIAKAAWGVGIIYLVLSATLSVDVLVRGKSPYLLRPCGAEWGFFSAP